MSLRAMVFAAGLGSRLRPLTDHIPKPAVPVANRPLAGWMLAHLATVGVSDVVLNTHHLPQTLQARLETCLPPQQRARFIHEPAILGTGGGLRQAWLPQPGESFIVANGDILFAPRLSQALEIHRQTGAIATMLLRPVPNPDDYGSIEIEPLPVEVTAGQAPAGLVRRLLGAPSDRRGPWRKLMFSGVHVLHPRAWPDLPEQGCIIRHSYRKWVDRGETVAALVDEGPWFDLGTPRSYLEANVALASGRLAWPGVQPSERGIIAANTSIHPEAQVRDCVVGEGVQIPEPLHLREVVAWPGSVLRADDMRAIHLDSGEIVRPGV